ncbi:hypothetical protein NMY22_g19045 [Coprinellus aureogranulatus]|nr:hypothetical protein NMY22_g19045 [Coprinellus aureogranulatus]
MTLRIERTVGFRSPFRKEKDHCPLLKRGYQGALRPTNRLRHPSPIEADVPASHLPIFPPMFDTIHRTRSSASLSLERNDDPHSGLGLSSRVAESYSTPSTGAIVVISVWTTVTCVTGGNLTPVNGPWSSRKALREVRVRPGIDVSTASTELEQSFKAKRR